MSDDFLLLGHDIVRHFPIGLSSVDRRSHVFCAGKTGTGKTTLLTNAAARDMRDGHGVAFFDPHGDSARQLLDFVPAARTSDVVYFDPSNHRASVGINWFEGIPPDNRPTVAAGLMGALSVLFDLSSSNTPRLLRYLRNAILALLDTPGATFLHVPLLFTDEKYRAYVLPHITNPSVRTFWGERFEKAGARYNADATSAILNQIEVLSSYPSVRNIIGQTKSTINLRTLMDERKIFIANLSTGALGDEVTNILGGALLTLFRVAAMSRDDTPEDERVDFYFYGDEIQRYANQSIDSLAAEARKMRFNMTLATQIVSTIPHEMRTTLIGNVGSLVVFRVGGEDAQYFQHEFPSMATTAFTDMWEYHAWVRTKSGMQPVMMRCLAPMKASRPRAHKVLSRSERLYMRPRRLIEPHICEVLSGIF